MTRPQIGAKLPANARRLVGASGGGHRSGTMRSMVRVVAEAEL